jgi:6-phosphogluconate dehydrogenase
MTSTGKGPGQAATAEGGIFPMQVGLVGLGRMGANMSRRWLRHGHTVLGFARHADTVAALVSDGAISDGATSLVDLVAKLEAPRVVWLMVPAASVDATLDQLVPLLGQGDVVVDGGNSYGARGVRHPLRRLRHERGRVGP